jgi:hypothetical protein
MALPITDNISRVVLKREKSDNWYLKKVLYTTKLEDVEMNSDGINPVTLVLQTEVTKELMKRLHRQTLPVNPRNVEKGREKRDAIVSPWGSSTDPRGTRSLR